MKTLLLPAAGSSWQSWRRLLALPLVALLAGPALAQTPATFGAVATYGTGVATRTADVTVADVNGDGRPDLLTANYNGSSVGVLLGTGAGTFGAATEYSTGPNTQPNSIAVADVNGDGKLDVITANTVGNTVSVLPGTGTGTFGAGAQYSTGTNGFPYSIAVADVNEDGRPDLLATNSDSGTVGVLLGTGAGAFSPVTQYSTGAGTTPCGLAVADVNLDGKLDLLTANNSSGTASVLLGTGTGTFGAVTQYYAGPNTWPRDVAVADVNLDGRPDLITANYNSNSAGVLLGTGTGAFGAATLYSTGAYSDSGSIAVADVNGDGQPDLVTANFNGSTAGVLLGTGTGTFRAIITYSTGTGSGPQNVAVADVNQDGRPDLLAANYSSRSVGVLLNKTPIANTATFGAATLYGTGLGSGPNRLVVADMNRDGQPDLLTSNFNDSTVGVLLGTSAGTFGAATQYGVGGSYPQNLTVADVNLDGWPDVVVANTSRSTLGVLLNTGTGTLGSMTTYDTGRNTYPFDVAMADVNGDGKPDLLTTNGSTSAVGVLLGTGTGTFGAISTFSSGTGGNPLNLVVADVNGDGKLDVLTANSTDSTVGVLLGTGTGTFGPVAQYSTGAFNSHPHTIVVADVNQDGRLDVVVGNFSNSTAGVLLGTGTGTFGAVTEYSTGPGSQPTGLAVADVNRDGRPDILSANYYTNSAGVLLSTGAGTFGTAATYSTGPAGYPIDVVVLDVNRDGRPDLVTANGTPSTVAVLLNTGTVLAAHAGAAVSQPQVTVYPNPAPAGAATLALSGLPATVRQVQATLLDALGRVVSQATLPVVPAQGTAQASLPTAGLAPSLYLLRLTARDARGAAVGTLPTQRLAVE